jgi:uncharacterized membrane protein
MADHTRDSKIIAFAQRQVTTTDWMFTFGGVTLVAIGGYGNAALHGMPLTVTWLAWGNVLFLLSGVIWIAILIPVQIRLARITRMFAEAGSIPDHYWRLEALWVVFGVIATVLPVANIPIMVFKPE